jgi:formate hydrogenlyase subunit 4
MGFSLNYILISLIVFYAIIPLILDGLERKLKAALQSRIGPPVTQTVYDVLKLLLVKETKNQPTLPYVTLTLLSSMVMGLLALYYVTLYIVQGDIINMFYALALLAVFTSTHTVTPLLVPNPYSYIGGMREVMLAVVNEAAFITSISLYTIILQKTLVERVTWVSILIMLLVAIVAFISSYATSSRVPFDIAEAEPELASGVFIEFSGRILALNIYNLLLRRLAAKFLVLAPTVILISGHGLISLILVLLLTPLIWALYATIAVVLGRSRVDIAPLTLAKIYITLLLISITGLLVITHA